MTTKVGVNMITKVGSDRTTNVGFYMTTNVGFFDPVDWRPREWNIGADYLANCALQAQMAGGTITNEMVQQCLHEKKVLQFFTDGGYKSPAGAFSVQLVEHYFDNGTAKRHMIGYWCETVCDARSAFEMELLALDKAVEFLWKATRLQM